MSELLYANGFSIAQFRAADNFSVVDDTEKGFGFGGDAIAHTAQGPEAADAVNGLVFEGLLRFEEVFVHIEVIDC